MPHAPSKRSMNIDGETVGGDFTSRCHPAQVQEWAESWARNGCGPLDHAAPHAMLADIKTIFDDLLASASPFQKQTWEQCAHALDGVLATHSKKAGDVTEAWMAEKLTLLSAIDTLILPENQLVKLCGLQGRPDLNGRIGYVAGKRDKERFPVCVRPFARLHPETGSSVADGESENVKVKPRNLRLWRPHPDEIPMCINLLTDAVLTGQFDSVEIVANQVMFMAVPSQEKPKMSMADFINVPINPRGMTCLSMAARQGQPRVVEALLKYGADPKLQDAQGATALGMACYFGHDEVIRLMVRNAKGLGTLDVADEFGSVPLCIACHRGKVSTLEVLVDEVQAAGRSFSPEQLYIAAKDAALEQFGACIQVLVEKCGLDVNLTPTSRDDPLLLCMCQNKFAHNERMVRYVLSVHADPDARASDGFTAFNLCCQNGNQAFGEVLLGAGADPTITSNLCCSPILSALDNGHTACAEMAFDACCERATRLGQPELQAQAEADRAFFAAAPRGAPGLAEEAQSRHGVPTNEELEKTVEAMAGRTVSESDEALGNDCVVCFQTFGPRDRLVRLGCGHEFHTLCLCNWIDIKPSCPTCRAPV